MTEEAVGSTGAKGSILLVEDDDFLRNLIVAKLEAAGYEAAIAKDGESALSAAATKLPDIILLDLILPGISGFELIAKLRQDEATATVPFMVLSNSEEQGNKKNAEHMGTAGYLVKAESTPADIVAAVDAWFAAHRGA